MSKLCVCWKVFISTNPVFFINQNLVSLPCFSYILVLTNVYDLKYIVIPAKR